MKINEIFLNLIRSEKQTKFFVFMLALYTVALIWTTVQSYARLEYSRSDRLKPIIIQAAPEESKK